MVIAGEAVNLMRRHRITPVYFQQTTNVGSGSKWSIALVAPWNNDATPPVATTVLARFAQP